jgi:hypothetical protein
MMKRYIHILGVLAAALVLSGCVKQGTEWAPETIAFRPLIGHDTRAVESVPFPQDRSFKVWAKSQNAGMYLDGGMYLDAEEISYGEDGWVASKKWPRHELEFEACWPTDLAVEFSPANGLQLRDFDCSKGDLDILMAHASDNDEIDGFSVLRFDHILARIDFRMVHSLPESMSVRLKRMELRGFANKGDYNTKKKDEWTVNAYEDSYVVYDAGQTDGIEIGSGTASYIGGERYVIPQMVITSLDVTYELRYGTAGWVPQTESIDVIETIWDPSKHYRYTITLRTDRLTHTTGISSMENIE